MTQTSLRESLEKSFDVLDGEEQEEAGGSEQDTEESLGDTEEGQGADAPESGDAEEGELAGEGPDSVDDDLPDGPAEEGDGAPKPVSAEADELRDEEPPQENLKAPVSWKPATREHWAKLPKEVKQEVLRREGDIQKGLQQASQHRKVAEEYYGIVRPYENMIRAAGATPSQAINSMFTTAMTLTMGTPKQKAEMVRDIIENYSVDIETLDQTLAGMEVRDTGDPALLSAIDERLAPVTSFMNQMQGIQQNQDAQLRHNVDTELSQFSQANEFYEDVRETMADLMEIASKHNRTLTLQDAYNQACQLNPEVKKVLAHREARGRAARPDKEEITRKRLAASSVANQGPTGAADAERGKTLRGAIEAAFEDRDL